MLFDLDFDSRETFLLRRKLQRLGSFALQKKVGLKALRAGLSVWRKYIRKNLPHRSGQLKRALWIRQDTVSAERKQAIHENIVRIAEENKAAGSPMSREEVIKAGSKGLRASDQIGMSLGVRAAARLYAHIVEFGHRHKRRADGTWRRALKPSIKKQVFDAVGKKLFIEMKREMSKN